MPSVYFESAAEVSDDPKSKLIKLLSLADNNFEPGEGVTFTIETVPEGGSISPESVSHPDCFRLCGYKINEELEKALDPTVIPVRINVGDYATLRLENPSVIDWYPVTVLESRPVMVVKIRFKRYQVALSEKPMETPRED